MNKYDAFLQKKVAGVKTAYLLLIAALIAAFVGYNIYQRNRVPADAEPVEAESKAAYPVISNAPTPVVTGGSGSQNMSDFVGELTNDQWEVRAINAIVAAGKSSTLEAQQAIQAYLNAENLNWQQRSLVEYAASSVGLPPVPPNVGELATPPATVQAVGTPAAVTPSAPGMAPWPFGARHFQIGDKGPDIGRIQAQLNSDSMAGLTVNNSFDELMQQAVINYQQFAGIPMTGTVGPEEWGRLFA